MRSEIYWQKRYAFGGDSGGGSAGSLLNFKASWLNEFIKANDIGSVLDFGSGDLRVAEKLQTPSYIGIDIFDVPKVPRSTMRLLKSRFDEYNGPSAELVLCLDVLYHILEDEKEYLHRTLDKLVEKADRFLIIYAQDSCNPEYDLLLDRGRRRPPVDEPEFTEHLYNSKWIQYLEENHNDKISLTHKQEESEPEVLSLFYVYEKTPEDKNG